MPPLFPNIDNYTLVGMPVEPYASNRKAPPGVYWLQVLSCSITRRKKRYHTKIRAAVVNHELDPPFKAIYELDERLTYAELCMELANIRVFLCHPRGIDEACRQAVRTVGFCHAMDDDAPPWECVLKGVN